MTVLWDFSADTPSVPDKAALDAAVAQVDYRHVTVNGTTVVLEQYGAEALFVYEDGRLSATAGLRCDDQTVSPPEFSLCNPDANNA